ncbi:MAG: hypothetical protein DRJ50_04670 [Actinobacteria bacterium]|nr:MAG: hypothetical protein DRJ50_04670 [Actinomycetota bacterium]
MFAILPISTTYQLVGLLHILAAVIAFGPLFLYPRLQRAGETQAIASLHMKLVFPALVLLWVLGMGLAGIGKYDMAETKWMGGSIGVWLATMVVSWFLIKPSLADTSEGARSKLSAGIGITHILLIIALYLMIFQPGGSVFKP